MKPLALCPIEYELTAARGGSLPRIFVWSRFLACYDAQHHYNCFTFHSRLPLYTIYYKCTTTHTHTGTSSSSSSYLSHLFTRIFLINRKENFVWSICDLKRMRHYVSHGLCCLNVDEDDEFTWAVARRTIRSSICLFLRSGCVCITLYARIITLALLAPRTYTHNFSL